MTDFRVTKRLAALSMAAGLVAGCGTSSPTAIDYKSDSRSKQASLAVPPNLLDAAADQRSLPPQGGQATLSDLQQVQKAAPSAPTVVPPVSGMHIQRDGTERWLVIDNKSPDQVWPQIRRFWQEQGFLLVVDSRDKGVMETDWNETHPQISDGLIRNTLSKATGNSYVTAERNKYRTRLEVAPNGGTYVFVSQKGMREALTGVNNDSSQWQARPNDPALENEYLKRLMASLAVSDSRQASGASLDSVCAGQGRPGRRRGAEGRDVGGCRHGGAKRRARRADGGQERHGAGSVVRGTDAARSLRPRVAARRHRARSQQLHRRRPRSRAGHLFRALCRSEGLVVGGAGLLEPGLPRQEGEGGEAVSGQRTRHHGRADPRLDRRRQGPGRFLAAGAPDHGAAFRSDWLTSADSLIANKKTRLDVEAGFFILGRGRSLRSDSKALSV